MSAAQSDLLPVCLCTVLSFPFTGIHLFIFLSFQIVLGTLLAALVPVVGFNAVMTSEHFGGFLVSERASKYRDSVQAPGSKTPRYLNSPLSVLRHS